MYPYLAFHSCDLYFKVVMENTFNMEDSYELDQLVAASPASASVLDIFAASGSRPLPKEAVLNVPMGGASEVTKF